MVLITEQGQAWVCGDNSYGQLGLGDSLTRKVFTQVNFTERVSQVATGDKHSVLITKKGELWSCGSNYYGQLGSDSYGSCNVFTVFG